MSPALPAVLLWRAFCIQLIQPKSIGVRVIRGHGSLDQQHVLRFAMEVHKLWRLSWLREPDLHQTFPLCSHYLSWH